MQMLNDISEVDGFVHVGYAPCLVGGDIMVLESLSSCEANEDILCLDSLWSQGFQYVGKQNGGHGGV